MCSTTDLTGGATRGARLAMLAGHLHELSEAVAHELSHPDSVAELATLHPDAVAAQLRHLIAAADQSRASAALLTGVVDSAVSRRHLVDGTYASTTRFLEVETGLSKGSATALTARARDLRDAADDGDPRLRHAWLSGVLSDDKVRELTLGIRAAVKHQPGGERDAVGRHALDLLLPIATSHTVAELKRAISRLRFVLDPDGVRRAELEAYDEQSLTCTPIGYLVRVQAFLDPEAAAALMTVLDQLVTGWQRDGATAPEERLPDGVDPDSAEGRRRGRARLAHLRAIALSEVMTGLLGRSDVGMHHGIRPHTVMHVDVRDLLAGLGGELTLPGSDDPVLLSSDAVRRILCDTGLSYVITQPTGTGAVGGADSAVDHVGAAGRSPLTTMTAPRSHDQLPDLLRERAVDVLYVGREDRTASPRLRRALEARDRHCQAPGCRRHVRRCHAHHVEHWEDGGETSIANCLLLCERHHRALHAGQLSITRDLTRRPTESGYFRVHPPDRPAWP